MSRLFFMIALFASLRADAAYRVYRLKITYYDAVGRARGGRVVESTLDPLQYEHYHGGYRRMRVEMVHTWYCPGDTGGFRPYCAEPAVRGDRAPSSLDNDPKRVVLPYNRQPVIPQ